MLGLLATPAAAQVAPYKVAEADLAIDGLRAEVESANPVVPKNIATGVRVAVRAGGRALTAEEAASFLGGAFEVRAELAGPGLRRALSLPPPDAPPSDDPLLLRIPGLTVAGDYVLSGLRIVSGGGPGAGTLLDVAPRQLTLRVIDQVLVTSVRTRPLTMAELQDRGVLIDADSYLGFEFTIALLLESAPIEVQLPVVFNRQGVPMPPVIPLPPPIRREQAPLIVPVLFQALEGAPPEGGEGDGGGGGAGDGAGGGPTIPSVLVFPGRVGYLKQHFSAQLFAANGAPAGSGLTVHDVSSIIHLPPGADAVPGTDDDPLVLAPLVEGPPSATLPVRGVGPDGEPGTGDDVNELGPGALGQAEFVLRGEREGFHNLSFDLTAVLEGLPTGPVNVTGRALGGVLVRNARFDMTFVVPNVVRVYEPFKLTAIVSNIGRGDAQDLSVTLDRMSGARLVSPADGTVHIPFLAAGDARTVEFELESQRTGQVVASYLHFDTSGSGRLNFTLEVGERGVPLSPDTLVLPTSLDGLPPAVVAAAMRVLGQAWSVATAPPERLQASVLRIAEAAVKDKVIALAEAGLRVQLGQSPAAAVRDLAFDFHGGTPLGFDQGFDQLLRQTQAGRNLAFVLGEALAAAAQGVGGPAAYERASAEIAASGADFLALSVRGTGGPVGVTLSDAAGRRTILNRATAATDLPVSEIPGAVLLPLGTPATAPTLGLLTAPTQSPYLLKADGPAEVSVTFPRGDGSYRRGTATVQHPARIAMDFGALSIAEDTDDDGTYDTPRDLVLETLTSQGPRLVSATVVGPETLRGASIHGTNAALLFDRMVGADSAADNSHYHIPANEALGAKRQLSGRMVFLGLAQPEGNYVPTTLSVSGIADTHGVPGPGDTVPLTSRLQEPGAVVSGRVVNADGRPFADGQVFYSQYKHGECRLGALLQTVAVARTDGNGRYEFRYVTQDPCGFPFQMAVYDPVNAAKRSVQLYVRAAGERMVADLALMGRGTVTGIVRDASGEPVGGALVVAQSVTDAEVGGHAQTDGDGRYTIRNVLVGGVNVRAVQGIHVGQAAGRIERAGGTATVNVRLEGGAASISGRVFKLDGGQATPVPGAYVQYKLASDGALLGVAVTDAEGRYDLRGMPAGNFRLAVQLNQRDRADVSGHVDEGQTLEGLDLVVVIPPDEVLGSVRGTVRLYDGAPAEHVMVSAGLHAVLTAADGSYHIPGLAVPSNPVVIARAGDRSATAYALLSTAYPHAVGIDITLPGEGAVEFTVLDPAGQPLSNQAVALQGSCGNPCGCSPKTSDAQGKVRFEGLSVGLKGAIALRVIDGVQDVATGTANLERAGQTAAGVLRFAGVGTVRGTVVDQGTGQAIHGADVRLRSIAFTRDMWTCGLQRGWNQQTSTAANGAFEFRGVNAGPVQVAATQTFYGQSSGGAAGILAHGQTVTLQVSLRNTMAGGLSGTVRLPDGETPVGAGLEVTVNGVLPDVTVLTDAEGHYEFAEVLPEGLYVMTVQDRTTGGMARQRIYLRAQQDAVHDVRLLGRGAVEVTVADGGDQVVDSATVRLRQTEYPFRVYDGVVQPATQGVVRFEDVVEGPFTVEASDVYGRGGRGSGQVARPEETVAVRVRLTVTGVVRGHFRMPDSTPIPYGAVRLTSGGRAIGQILTQGSGDMGAFAFDYVPAGQVRLDAEDPATARTGLAVGTLESEDQELTLDIRAQALGTVRGRVTGDGTAQPGALVQITSGSYRVNTAADSDGRYEVPGIPEGRVTVTASLDGGYLQATAAGTLSGEGGTLELDVALRQSGEVRGTVTEADGETPARAAVSTWMAPGGYFTHHTTEDGRFDFTRLPAGRGLLVADEIGSIDLTKATVDVPPGGLVEVPLRLNGVGSVRGQARGSSGAPTGGYLALTGGPTYPWSFWAALGPDGRFYVPEALAGPVTATLRVDSGGFSLYGTASGTILPGQETVLDVQVQASGTVTGVALRAGGTIPAFGATVTLLHERGTVRTGALADGRFTFRGVPLGTFTLTVHDEVTNARAKVRNRQVTSNGQTVDLGILELDATPPSITVVEPAADSSRPPLGGDVVVDLADGQTGIDASSFQIVYAGGGRQTASEFTFEGGRAHGRLRQEWQVVGPNILRFEVQDLAGNLALHLLTYTATGATLQGHVRKHDGAPAGGARVDFSYVSPATAGEDGAYTRGGLRPGNYYVWATDLATGIRTDHEPVTVFDGETRTKDLVLPAFGSINGVVRRVDGSPAPGAIVSYGPRSATAGPGGVFDLGAFDLGTYNLDASDPARGDRARATVILANPGQVVTTEIRLNGVGNVGATVRNADGTPVSGALVRAWSSSALGWYGAELATPAGGNVSWTQALAGTITVLAREPVHNLAGQATGLLGDGATLALTVTLEPAGSVRGTVYRAGGTVRAANVDVVISGAASRIVRTNDLGEYTIPDVRLSGFTVVATDPASGDTGRASGVVSSAAPVTADIVLNGVGSVQVLVRKANGDAAPGAGVTIATSADVSKIYEATTGADGRASVPNVLAGTVTVGAALASSFSSGQATAVLAPGQSLDVAVTLQAVGTIRGRVLAPDGVTPVPGVLLWIHMGYHNNAYATSEADGAYEFPELPAGGGYVIRALVRDRVRAQSPVLPLTSQGLVHDIVLVGVGTVSGTVTDPAGAPLTGAYVRLQVWGGPYAGAFGTTTAGGGAYSLADIPVGPFTLTAWRDTPAQSVDATGAIDSNGEALTVNLQLLESSVTVPYALGDGNLINWRLETDGGLTDFHAVGGAERALKLSLVEGGTVRPFVGAGTTAASEHEKREIVVRQAGLAGLNVTRKTFVSEVGYFGRSLEMLENPGAAPVTVDVVLESQFGLGGHVPGLVDSSDGDAEAEPGDDWVMVDDAETQDIYDAMYAQFPPVGIVASGPGGVRPSVLAWDGTNRRLTTRWNAVTVMPGQKAGFVTLITPQADRARARASAQRLSQMPPEALFGLTAEEAAAVRNVLVPVSLASALEPLPPNDGVITGRLLGGDGQTPVAGRPVTVRSRSPHYGRPLTSQSAAADGAFSLTAVLTPGYVWLIPRTDFDLRAPAPLFTSETATVHGRFEDAGVRNLAAVPGRTVVASTFHSQFPPTYAVDGQLGTLWLAIYGDSAEPPYNRAPFLEVGLPDEATVHEVRVRCSLGSPAHLIRRARVEVKGAGAAVLRSVVVDIPSETGSIDVPLSPPVAGARSVRLTSLADGGLPTVAEIEVLGEGIPGPTRLARQDLVFTGRGVLEGKVQRSDLTPIPNSPVTATAAQAASTSSDAAGNYRFPVVPPGGYTLRAELPLHDYSVTLANVPVDAGQKTTRDIVVAGLGRIRGAAFTAGGQPVSATFGLSRAGVDTRYLYGTTYDFIDLPPGAYTLTASINQGSVSLPVTITAEATTTQDVTFPPVGTAQVTVTVDGLPLYHALVHWSSAANPVGGEAYSNGAGQATLTGVMGPTFTVRATHPDNANAFAEANATMPAEGATVPVALDVPGLGSIAGTARSLNGVAEPSALVRVLRASDGALLAQVNANAAGQFSLGNIPEGPVRLVGSFSALYTYWMTNQGEVLTAITANGQALALDGLVPRGALTAAHSADLWEYTLAQGQAGGLLAIGAGLGADAALADPRLEVYGPDGALVASNEDRTPTDKNAEVAFNAPQPGRYLAVVRGAGPGAYRIGTWAGNDVAFRRYAGVTVTGHVVREGSGAPAANAPVYLSALQPGGLSLTASTTTQADGSYRFDSVPAGAAVTVQVKEGGAVVGEATGTTGAIGTTLDLPITRLALGQVEVRASYRGAAFPGLSVEVFSSNPAAPESLRHQAGVTAADGRRVFTVVPAGTITAQATDPIVGGALEATGTLADGGTLVLQLTLSDGGDSTPPAAVGNLSAATVGVATVRLTWTAPGDDGSVGTAAAYDLRYATSPLDAANFASAAVAPTPTPAAAGSGQTFDISGLAPNVTYYFALKARDEAYNWSEISNVAQASTGSVPAAGLKLWLKADAGVGLVGTTSYVSSWQDQSGSGNHASQATAASQPTLVLGELNGQPVLRFDGANDWLAWTSRLTTIRTVFMVIRESPAASAGYRFLLGDATNYDFCAGDARQIWSSCASAAVRSGDTRLNGVLINGTTTNRPTSPAVLSLVTTGPVTAGRFSNDRTYGNHWWGDLAELIVYDRVVTDIERLGVEAYLAQKYALFVPALPAPTVSPNGGTLSGATTVTLQTSAAAGIRYTLDGSEPTASSPLYTEPLSVAGRTTVKAKAFAAGWSPSPTTTVTFLASGDASPASIAGLKLWVRADAGVSGSGNVRVTRWSDQSSQANDLTQTELFKQPLVLGNAAAGLPALTFDGADDWLGWTARLTTIRTVFWVVRENTAVTSGFHFLLGDPINYDFASEESTARRIWSNSYTSGSIKNGQTRLNGVLVNGTTTSRPTAFSLISLVTTGPVTAGSFSSDRTYGNHWWGDLAELVVYDTALSDADRGAVEQYLAARYGITLP